jgi:hypothetical protein
MLLKTVVGLLIAVVAFVAWRYTSVTRGAGQRDEALLQRLDPLAKRFESGAVVIPNEVSFATSPELREMLHALLEYHKRLDLFPQRFLSEQAQAESMLAYWMLHPNELQAVPEEMVMEEKMRRDWLGKQGTFYVFRFKMPEGHWAGREWQLGLAAPYSPDDKPYAAAAAGAFSRGGDVVGKITPGELVDWYVSMRKQKGGA